ncbi:3 beta-hydroxysteroid dehydrogenase/Delta 5--_4-isomerase type 1-like [Mytilus galloprovincialis]|uniref:3 beta-hydroxysteroid dehydrogenase/Delta 5-->4-isomerase type 1-like n=1 Tax=Mytilus galloprovincialis TaxID=29158 RepID=UPI003F7C2598
MTKILVTGGSGCVGQHIIKHFQEYVNEIKEIRVLDLQKFEQKLEYENKIPVVCFTGNITDVDLLVKVTRDVQCVIHTAAYVDVRLFPDKEKLDIINRQGTKLLLEACYQNKVEMFIHCSTIDVMQGYHDIVNGNEANTKPDRLLFGEYARTKQAGERAVLSMNNKLLPNGIAFRTISLRPMVIYGELDQHFIPQAIEAGLQNKKIMIDFCGNGACCLVYVGNIAWAFVCAYKAMRSDKTLGGEAFLIKDNSPNKSMMQFCKPYFDSFNISLYRSFVPYWILYVLISFIHILLFLMSPLKKVQFPVTTATLIYTNLALSFDDSKARKMLQYRPLYTPVESYKCSLKYYNSLSFDNKKKH